MPQHLGIELKHSNTDRTQNERCSQSSCNLLQSVSNFGSSHRGLTAGIHSMFIQGSGYCHDLNATELALHALQAFTVSVTWFLYVDSDDWIPVAQRQWGDSSCRQSLFKHISPLMFEYYISMKIHKFTEVSRQIWTVGSETLICWLESAKQEKILMGSGRQKVK